MKKQKDEDNRLKEFLKPTWGKIVLTVFLLIMFFFTLMVCTTFSGSAESGDAQRCSWFFKVLSVFPIGSWGKISFLIFLIELYVVSCIVTSLIKKLKNYGKI